MPKKRPKTNNAVLRKMHIYCEGEKTEPLYIQSYIDKAFGDRLRGVVVIEDTKKNTPVQLVNEAKSSIDSGKNPDGDVYWVVYDRESPAKYNDALHEQAHNLAQKSGINIAISNVCFEFWLILHFIDSNAPYSSYDDLMAKSCLKTEVQARSKKKYDKGSSCLYDIVSNGIGDARRRAKAINKQTLASAPAGTVKPHRLNPYTAMPILLDAIDSFAG